MLFEIGHKLLVENGTYRVPKRNLVSVIQVPLQQGRLKVAYMLPEASTLAGELQNFHVKIISDSALRIIVKQPTYFSQTCY